MNIFEKLYEYKWRIIITTTVLLFITYKILKHCLRHENKCEVKYVDPQDMQYPRTSNPPKERNSYLDPQDMQHRMA